MDETRFDQLTRRLGQGITRRRVVASMLGLAAGAAVLRDQADAARCRDGGRACTNDGNCCAGRCERLPSRTGVQARFVCGCPTGQILCNSRCVDPTSSPIACGGCGRRCRSGQSCVDRVCVTGTTSPTGPTATPAPPTATATAAPPTTTATPEPPTATPCPYTTCGSTCCAQHELCISNACANPCSTINTQCIATATGGNVSDPGDDARLTSNYYPCSSDADCEANESTCATENCFCIAAIYNSSHEVLVDYGVNTRCGYLPQA
jgi:hypothetical protein